MAGLYGRSTVELVLILGDVVMKLGFNAFGSIEIDSLQNGMFVSRGKDEVALCIICGPKFASLPCFDCGCSSLMINIKFTSVKGGSISCVTEFPYLQ